MFIKCMVNEYVMVVVWSICEFCVFILCGWIVVCWELFFLLWDFIIIFENEVVVILLGEKKLVILKVDFILWKVIFVKEIILIEVCWSVIECKGNLIGIFVLFEFDVYLKVMILDGIMEREIVIMDCLVLF